MTPQLRVGIVGCGQAYRRLYAPAFRGSRAYVFAGAVDPADTPADVRTFETVEAMCASGDVDCVVVLSPPAFHAEHVAAVLRCNLPVLVEKPPALTAAEVSSWAETNGGALVTPAFSRRYWPDYREQRPEVRRWQFVLTTNPADWGATHHAAPEEDLLPHVVDLARWLSGTEIEAVKARRVGALLSGEFRLAGGRSFAWEVGHGASYAERLEADGTLMGRPATRWQAMARAVRRGAGRDVDGVSAMLAEWAIRLAGGSPPALPSLTDASRCVETIEAVRRQVTDAP